MAATRPRFGIRHHTIVPANFEPDMEHRDEDEPDDPE